MAVIDGKKKYSDRIDAQFADKKLFESINSTTIEPPYRIKGMMRRDFSGDDSTNIIKDIEQKIATGHLIKTDRATSVAKTTIAGRAVIIKRYNNQGFLNSLKYTLAGSRAKRVWRETYLLQALDIVTPSALGYFDVLRGGRVIRSYLINDFCPGPSLHDLLLETIIRPDEWPAFNQQVGELLNSLHTKGVTHGDIKHTNILYDKEQLVLIDLDSLIIHHSKNKLKHGIEKDQKSYIKKISTDANEYIKRKKIELNISN